MFDRREAEGRNIEEEEADVGWKWRRREKKENGKEGEKLSRNQCEVNYIIWITDDIYVGDISISIVIFL